MQSYPAPGASVSSRPRAKWQRVRELCAGILWLSVGLLAADAATFSSAGIAARNASTGGFDALEPYWNALQTQISNSSLSSAAKANAIALIQAHATAPQPISGTYSGTQCALTIENQFEADYIVPVGYYVGSARLVTLNLEVTDTPASYTLTLAFAGAGAGTVTANGQSYSTSSTLNFAAGTKVALAGMAATHSSFAGFSGAATGESGAVVMDGHKAVTATFIPVLYTLTLTIAGTGKGIVTADGVAYRGSTTLAFNGGTMVALTGIADTNYAFAGFSEDATGISTAVFMNGDRSVTATFNEVETPNSSPTISWTGTPGTVVSGATYTISASASDVDSNLVSIMFAKEGVVAGTPYSTSGSGGTASLSSGDIGPASILWTATATDASGASSTIEQTVTVSAPSAVGAAISATPTSVVAPGATTVSWSTSDATSVSVSGTGLSSTATNGSQTVSNLPAGVHTYTITAQGNGGPLTRTATVTVGEPVSASISATPVEGNAPGSSTITWNSANATSVSVNGPGLASTAASGSQLVSNLPAGTHTYTITAQGVSGPATDTVTLQISEPPTTAPVTAWISANPTSATAPASATISWGSEYATSVGVSGPGIPTSTTSSGSIAVPNLTAGTHTYTIIAEGVGGPVTRTASVVVSAAIRMVSAQISSVVNGAVAPGSATVTWTSEASTSVMVTGPNLAATTNATGSQLVTGLPSGTHIYTITAQGNGGPMTRTTSVVIGAPGTPVTASIGATETLVLSGDTTLLSWNSANATSVAVSGPNVSSAGATGSQYLYLPVGEHTYTITAQGLGGPIEKSVTIRVVDIAGVWADIAAKPAIIPANGGTTVIWNSRNATEVEVTSSVYGGVSLGSGASGQNYVSTFGSGMHWFKITARRDGEIVTDIAWVRAGAPVTPTITWQTPAPITYGTALGEAQLNATANVPGTFAYSPAAGAVPVVGSHQLSVTFTPTDTANYTTATATVWLTVNPATPVVSWETPSPIVYGTPLGANQLNATSAVPGVFAYSPGSGAVLPGGGHALAAVFTPADSANYTSASATVPLQVNPATQSIVVTPSSLMVAAGESRTFTASGGHNAYAWTGYAAGAVGNEAVTLAFPVTGSYIVSVTNVASSNYLASNTATARVEVVVARQVNSLTPLESNYTIADPASPMHGQTYRRMWQEGGWTAYLGRSGVRFQVRAQAWPSVRSIELEARPPGLAWTQIAGHTPAATVRDVDATFSVMLGETAPGQPLVPLSFSDGNPQTGTWLFRARVQDANGLWSSYSDEVPVEVVLPVTSKTLSGQTVPPAGELGSWFTASPVKTFTFPLWIP